MSNYVWCSHLSYLDYLQGKSFVGDVTSATRSAGRAVSMEISRQTRELIASNEAMARDNIRAIEANTRALDAGFEELSYDLREISSGISELNATFHWGFGEVIASLGHMNDALSELIKIAKTPVQTVAFNHFEIARDAFRQGLYKESLEELEKSISGDHTSAGYKLEWRFHQMKGTLHLGFLDADMSLVDLAKAEESFLLAARYGKTDYTEDAGRAFLSAGWAAYCQGKMKEALAHTGQAMELHPRMGEGFFQAAKVQMALDQVDAALPVLAKAIDLDRFYALKAAGDGDFQKHDKQLRDFLEALRKEKLRQATPEIDKALDTIRGYRLSDALADVKNRLERFRIDGASWPLMDILALAKEWRQGIGGFLTKELPDITIQMEIETQEHEQEEYQEKIVTRPAGFFRSEEFRIETRTRQRLVTRKKTLNNTITVIRDEWIKTIGDQPACTWEFCLIPAGSFMMGNKDRHQRKVNFKNDFYMGRYPVTQLQWESVIGKNPCDRKGENLPVEKVSWGDVQKYIQKLNELAGEERYQLPTEAHWEYACRAGSNGKYCFGDQETMLGEYAWYKENSNDETHPVGLKKPNAWGLYDMHGNGWELVQDINGKYHTSGSTSGSFHMVCSCESNQGAYACASSERFEWKDESFGLGFGFRLHRYK